MKIPILITLLLLAFFGNQKPLAKKPCSNEITDSNQEYYKKMSKVKELQLPLEEGTPFYSNYLQFLPKNNTLIVNFDRKIISYDIVNTKENYNFTIEPEGPFGIEKIGGMHYNSNDSIFIMEKYSRKVYLFNNQGEHKEMYDPHIGVDPLYPQALSKQNTPLIYRKGEILVAGWLPSMGISRNQKSKFLISYNIHDNTKKYLFDVPEKHSGGSWGLKNMVYYTIHQDEIIASFHISDSVFIYNLNSKIVNKFNASSDLFGEEKIKPFSKDIKVQIAAKNKDFVIDHDIENPSYDMILFDEWNNLYYRFARLPTTLEMIYQEKFPDMVLMVFDKNFRKLSEQIILSENYYHAGAFVSPDGLMLPNKKMYEENNNYLTYDAFSIIRKP